ncbi:MAG: hypothetical protein ACRENJ_02235, partial [Candidatus Eiseniibacteriota bacterium]
MRSEPRLPAPLPRRRTPTPRLILALLAACTSVVVVPGRSCAGADPGASRSDRPIVRLARADAWFGLGTLVSVGAAAFADHELRERALATDSRGARRLARAAEHLGSPEVMGPA